RRIWTAPVDLSCIGRASAADQRVFFPLGSGDLESSGPQPAGAIVALDAMTGHLIWRTNFSDSVVASPLVHRDDLIVGCRDGCVRSLRRKDGRVRWTSANLGPVLAAPVHYRGDEIVVLA